MRKGRESKVSLVVPVHNEAVELRSSIMKIRNALQDLGVDFEIIIAEDGSTDGSDIIAKELMREYRAIRCLHADYRLGRGAALKRAFEKSTGDILIYIDVDLSTSLQHLGSLLKAVEEGADIAVGSRLVEGALVKRSFLREIVSRVYNSLVRFSCGSPIHDHQCGFKAFRRSSTIDLLGEAKDNHWFWDTEVIVRAVKQGYSLVEVPVTWTTSNTSKVRLFQDMNEMGIQLFKLSLQLRGSARNHKIQINR